MKWRLMMAVALLALPASGCKTSANSQVKSPALAASGAQVTIGTFPGRANKKLAYQITRVPGGKSKVLFLQGYNQSYLTNQELINTLADTGYSVYALDNRGMGRSERILSGDKEQMGYVEDYNYYVDDAQAFIDQFVALEHPEQALGLLAHSTGGRIAVDILANNPGLFKSAVLSAPAFNINTGALPTVLADWVAHGAKLIGKGDTWPPGFGPFNPDADFAVNKNTSSPENFAKDRQIRLDHKEVQLGNPSFEWIAQMITAGKKVEALAPRVTTPTLIIKPGADAYVLPAAQDKFCALAPNCRIVPIEGSKHEAFNEVPAIRELAIRSLLTHFDETLLKGQSSDVGIDGHTLATDDRATNDASSNAADAPDGQTSDDKGSDAPAVAPGRDGRR